MKTNKVRIERIEQVSARTGLPKSSIYRLMADGSFPKPLRLSERATGWRSDQIDDWIMSLSVALHEGVQA